MCSLAVQTIFILCKNDTKGSLANVYFISGSLTLVSMLYHMFSIKKCRHVMFIGHLLALFGSAYSQDKNKIPSFIKK